MRASAEWHSHVWVMGFAPRRRCMRDRLSESVQLKFKAEILMLHKHVMSSVSARIRHQTRLERSVGVMMACRPLKPRVPR